MSGERAGVPSVGLMTDKFVSAAELMAQVLGASGYPFVTLPHPISSASASALGEAAQAAARQCTKLWTEP